MYKRFSLILSLVLIAAASHAAVSTADEKKAALAGIDANGNGVRDDVEANIRKNHPKEAESRAGMQLARALQRELVLSPLTREGAKKEAQGVTLAVNCLFFVFSGPPKTLYPAYVAEQIMDKTFDTKERKKVYVAFNEMLDGTTSTLPQGTTCEK